MENGRPVSTPARQPCLVPVAAMAEAIAREWDAQEGEVRPLEMPMTRTAATCIDRVLPNVAEVRANISAYGETELLCYRADQPAALNLRQREGWDPVLGWAAERFDATLNTGHGIMHIAQPRSALTRLAEEVGRSDPWRLTALSELTTISGSLILALAVLHGRLDAPEAWRLSRIDEQWNIEQWGEDAEAAAQAARREAEFLHSAAVLDLLRAA